MSRPSRPLLVALVLSTVLIQLLVAVILKELADFRGATMWTAAVIGLAVGLNGLRFLIWAYTHRHYPLSHSYPLTALFFPCILILSVSYGEIITARQLIAVAIIMTGIALMNLPSSQARTGRTDLEDAS